MEPFPHIRVEGSPIERGRSYGEQAAARVRRSIDAYREVFAHYAGWDWPKVTSEAMRYREPIERFGPRYLEEMQGVAEGAGVPFEDVLAINVRTEVMFAAKARTSEEGGRRVGECSAFAVLPEAGLNGHTLIGQNWDWLLPSFDTVVVLEAKQVEGPDFVTVVEAGLLAKTGMNSSGIGLVTNALVTDLDRGEPGVPYHLVLRGILDAENLSDALAIAQRGFRSSSANYLAATTDHTDVSFWVMPDSPFRLERLGSAVARRDGKLSIADFRSILADNANHPSGICCHPDARMDVYDQGATVASVLMDLDEKRMWVADGHPCTNPYRELDYAGFLSKPSPVNADRPVGV